MDFTLCLAFKSLTSRVFPNFSTVGMFEAGRATMQQLHSLGSMRSLSLLLPPPPPVGVRQYSMNHRGSVACGVGSTANEAAQTGSKKKRKSQAADNAVKPPAAASSGRKRSTRSASPSKGGATNIATSLFPIQPAVALAASSFQAEPELLTRASLLEDLPPKDSPLWSTKLWVTFSDLHVEERTLGTCLEVLRRVRDEALARDAGVLFLGDWWETRGTLPVEPLNLVLNELSTWTENGVPMLMLVGNHDQVNLGGDSHALEPLAAISRHFHVFTRPALFRNALWLPYRRQEDKLRNAIAAVLDPQGNDQPALPEGLSCVFAHADVQTAKMNYRTQARDGLPPGLFRGIPVFTGHYHLPHCVPNSKITYVGSPYQVHRNESGEKKRLLVLDASKGWSVEQEIPLDIGPRYYKHTGRNLSPQRSPVDASLSSSAQLAEPSQAGAPSDLDVESTRPGDVFKWVLEPGDLNSPDVLQKLEALSARGVHVELAMAPLNPQGPRMAISEEHSPSQVLDKYAASVGMSEAGLAEACAALQKALEDNPATVFPHVKLELVECEVEGYGPFKDRQVYPLKDRGLRVIIGENYDDIGLDSNGTGKSSLVAAPLWALTGDRLTEGVWHPGGVDSMLNKSCSQARVVLRGIVNGASFEVERVIKKLKDGKGKTAKLSLILDGEDQTQQDVSRTQDKINKLFSSSLAKSSIFFGREDIQTLLKANDPDFKKLLGQVVVMDVWPQARVKYIKEWRTAAKSESAKGAGQLELLKRQQAEREMQVQSKREELEAWEQQQQERLSKLAVSISSGNTEASSLVSQMDQKETQLKAGVALIVKLQAGLDQEVRELQAKIEQDLERSTDESEKESTDAVVADAAASNTSAPSKETTWRPPSATDTEAAPSPALALLQSISASTSVADQPGIDVHATQASQPSMASTMAPPPLPLPPLSVSLKEALLANQQMLPSLQATRESAARFDSKQQRAAAKAESRLSHVKDGLMEWVVGLLPADSRKATAGDGSKNVLQATTDAILDLSPNSTKEWLSSMSGLQPVCDKCGQQVDVGQFEHRIDEMKIRIKAAQDQYDAALLLQSLARTALNEADTELMQKESVVKMCRERYEEQAHLELQQQQAALKALKAANEEKQREQKKLLEAEREAIRAKQREEKEALRAERAAFEARQRAQKEAMAHCRRLEQQQQQARAAVQQGHDAVQALCDMRKRLAEELMLQNTQNIGGIQPEAHSDMPAPCPTEANKIQEAIKEVQQFCSAATKVMKKLDEVAEGLRRTKAKLEKVLAEVNPHKGLLEMLQEQTTQSQQALEATANSLDMVQKRLEALEEANRALGGSGVQSYVLEGVLGHLQTLTAAYMQHLTSNMVLELSATKPKASSKGDGEESMERIDKVVKYINPDGTVEVRATISGGEQQRISIALCLGFADLLKHYGRLNCNVLVLDEVLNNLDQAGCTHVACLLRELDLSSVFVVGQANSFVTQAFEKMDVVVKRDGCSAVIITP